MYAARLMALAGLLAAACAKETECDLDAEAKAVATSAATYCGRVLVDGVRNEVNECVLRELGAKRPFWARYDSQNEDGDEPEVATAVVGDPNGRVSFLEFTSSPCGTPACGARVVQVLCADPSAAPGEVRKPPVACGQTADPKAICD